MHRYIFLLSILTAFTVFAQDSLDSENLICSILSQTERLCSLEQNKVKPYAGDFVIPDSASIDGVRFQIYQVNDSAFFNCADLTSITIPPTVKSIGDNVFHGCSHLSTVTIEDGIIPLSLGYNTYDAYGDGGLFSKCKLEEVYIGRNLNYYKSNASGYYTYAPFCHSQIKRVRFGDNTSEIGPCLFAGCDSIIKLSFGKNIVKIGSHAFENGLNLEKLELPYGLQAIANDAFYGCHSLREVIMPETLLSLGENSFTDCPNIWLYMSYASTPPSARYAFYDVSNARLRVPEESIEKYKKSSGWMTFGEILSLDGISNPYPSMFILKYSIVDVGIIEEIIHEGESRNITLFPLEGYTIHSVTLNGIEQVIEANHSQLKLSSIKENQIIRIVYEQNVSSSINSNSFPTNKIILGNMEIKIQGHFTSASLFTLDGNMLFQGNNPIIKLPHAGVYILKIDNSIYKFYAD